MAEQVDNSSSPLSDKLKNSPTVWVWCTDIHVGSPLAVMPEFVVNADGQRINPSALQELINQHWSETWSAIFALKKQYKAKLAVFVSEVIEGVHHGNSQAWTQLETRMTTAAVELFKPVRKSADVLAVVSGTDAHSGRNGEYDELFADTIHADKATRGGKSGRLSANRMRVEMGGVLVDVAHHTASPGTRHHTKGNAFRAYIRSMCDDIAEIGKPVPRLWLRGHYHVARREYIESPLRRYECDAIISPSWTLMNSFAHRAATTSEVQEIGLYYGLCANRGLMIHNNILEIDVAEEL